MTLAINRSKNKQIKIELILASLSILITLLLAIIVLFLAIILINVLKYENYLIAPIPGNTFDSPINADPLYSWFPVYTIYDNTGVQENVVYIALPNVSSFWLGKNNTDAILIPDSYNYTLIPVEYFQLVISILLTFGFFAIVIAIINIFGIFNLNRNGFFLKNTNNSYLWYLILESFFTLFIISFIKMGILLFSKKYSKDHNSTIISATYINLIWSILFTVAIFSTIFFLAFFMIIPFLFGITILFYWLFLIFMLIFWNIKTFESSRESKYIGINWYCLITFNIISCLLFTFDEKRVIKTSKLDQKRNIDKVASINILINSLSFLIIPILFFFGVLILKWEFNGFWILIDKTTANDNTIKTVDDFIGGEKVATDWNSSMFYLNDPQHPYSLQFNVWIFLILFLNILLLPMILQAILFNQNIIRTNYRKDDSINLRNLFIVSLIQLNFFNSWKLLKLKTEHEEKVAWKNMTLLWLGIIIIVIILGYDIFFLNSYLFSGMATANTLKIILPNMKNWAMLIYLPLIIGMVSIFCTYFGYKIFEHKIDFVKINKQRERA